MTEVSSAMVLAAGYGTRMGALTEEQPKPLLRAAGRTLLDHTLDHLEDAAIGHAVVNLHYRGAQIRAHLLDRATPRISFSDEQPEILDTGGGVVQALPFLGASPFVTINSDAIFGGPNPVKTLVEAWDSASAGLDALLLLVPKEQTHCYTREGDFFWDQESRELRRRGDAPIAPFVYAGAQIIRPEAYVQAPEGAFSNNLIWDRLLQAGRIGAAIYTGQWIDVGTPEGLTAADSMLGCG